MQTHEVDGIGFTTGGWPLDPSRATLIFIHGSGGSNALWNGQVDALAERANTVALDLPGRGLSRGPGRERGLRHMADYAKVVADFARAIDAPRPIPCGLSLGGGIVLQLVLDDPGRWAGAVLIGTGARLRVMPAVLEGVERDYAAHLANLALAASPQTDPETLKPLMTAHAQCPAEVALGDFIACDRFDVMDRLGEIEIPVLIVSGEDDKLTPPKYADYLERNISNTRRVHLLDAGHLAPAEKPAEVNAAILEFLAGSIRDSG